MSPVSAPLRVATPVPEEPPEFGALLGHYRRRAGLSQNALAKRAEIPASYVCRLESGVRGAPSMSYVLALSRALGLTPADEDGLLISAGYIPDRLAALWPVDPLVAELAATLRSARLPAGVLAMLRESVGQRLATAREMATETPVPQWRIVR